MIRQYNILMGLNQTAGIKGSSRSFVGQVKLCLLSITLFICIADSSKAGVKLPSILGDNMVLQQKSRVKLWGSAKPFKKVIIRPEWGPKVYTAISDQTGAWETSVTTTKAGGPFKISFDDGEQVVLNNIMLGEVWVCSGQSNMVMPLKGYDKGQDLLNGSELIAESGRYPNIRIFDVPKVISAIPLTDCNGSWKISNPENAANFSAIGFQYAKILNEKLGVPIGVITACWGSTAIQSWMSESNLSQFPEVERSSRLDTMKIPAKNAEKVTSVLFNGMISPITRFGIKGFLWYQGESNKSPGLYQKLLPAMVKEWRDVWGRGKLPFYYVQIAPYNYSDRNTALLREAQLKARIPNSEMVVALDAGMKNRIHPPDKTILSQRLSACALAKTYNQHELAYKSPKLRTVKLKPWGAVLRFKDVYEGLRLKNSVLTDFEIAGNDQIFHVAAAMITGKDRIRLTSTKVERPVAVRYAFKNWVEGHLLNSAGLPASSFRTDDFNIP